MSDCNSNNGVDTDGELTATGVQFTFGHAVEATNTVNNLESAITPLFKQVRAAFDTHFLQLLDWLDDPATYCKFALYVPISLRAYHQSDIKKKEKTEITFYFVEYADQSCTAATLAFKQTPSTSTTKNRQSSKPRVLSGCLRRQKIAD